jgi:hypothetical protein
VDKLQDLQAGGILLNEMNVEWHNCANRENTHKLLQKLFGRARIEYGTSKVKFDSPFNPCGNLSAAAGPWSHRVVKTGNDATGCGRWTYMTYALKKNAFFSVVTAYRVCKQTDLGNKTAYMQQCTVQYEDEDLRPFFLDPHRQTTDRLGILHQRAQ